MKVRRRELLAGTALMVLTGRLAADEGPRELSDEEIESLLVEEAEPPPPGVKAIIGEFWFKLPPDKRSTPIWAPQNLSYDYSHIAQYATESVPFEFSGDVLREYCRRSFYEVDFKKRVLFGLRGCQLADGSDAAVFSDNQSIIEATPDHNNLLCLIGVFNPDRGQVALYRASTVPNISLMDQQIRGTLGCNMLPTGLHQYRVGLHHGKSLRQPGAFIQQSPLWVHRAKTVPEYTFGNGNVWDDLDGALPFDDIHAAILNYRAKAPFFSSAGCQVIAGSYNHNGAPIGPWANFRVSAGLSHPPQDAEDGQLFEYVLLTGKEAHLVADGSSDKIMSVRHGSSGASVLKLQSALEMAMPKKGVFDRETLGLYLKWQNTNRLHLTGIVTEKEASMLRIKLQ